MYFISNCQLIASADTHYWIYKILPVVVVGCVVTDVTIIGVVVPKYRLKIWSQYK